MTKSIWVSVCCLVLGAVVATCRDLMELAVGVLKLVRRESVATLRDLLVDFGLEELGMTMTDRKVS